jgi:hypothetical protein
VVENGRNPLPARGECPAGRQGVPRPLRGVAEDPYQALQDIQDSPDDLPFGTRILTHSAPVLVTAIQVSSLLTRIAG